MRAYVIRVPARNHAAAVRPRAIRVGAIRHARTSAALRLETSSQVTTRLCTSQRSSRSLPSSVTIAARSCCTFSATRRKACAHAEKPVDRETEDAPTCAVRGQPIVNPRLLRKKTRRVVANRTLACHCHQAIGTVPVGSGANQLSQTVKFLAKNHKQAARRRCNSPSPIDRSAGGGSCRVDVFVVLRMLLADVDLTKNVREHVARR